MDIVERLRVRNHPFGWLELIDKAADEIERLNHEADKREARYPTWGIECDACQGGGEIWDGCEGIFQCDKCGGVGRVQEEPSNGGRDDKGLGDHPGHSDLRRLYHRHNPSASRGCPMTLKEALESAWTMPLFFPNHIVIWSNRKYGLCVHAGLKLFAARGRKVGFQRKRSRR